MNCKLRIGWVSFINLVLLINLDLQVLRIVSIFAKRKISKFT